jgi:uncharacterized protein
MQYKIVNPTAPRTLVAVFATGDEVVSGLQRLAQEQHGAAAAFSGLGALSDLVLGYFDWEEKTYRRIPLREQVEVVSLVGNFALGEDGKPSVHPHIVVGRADGSACGGHLLEAHVRPTLEVVVTEAPSYLQRRHDPQSGLPLIRL